jgi:putative endonuclease
MSKDGTHLITGKQGEDAAAQYLLQQGYRILEKNWRFEKAEIDLIATIENLLVFIEVKTRNNENFGYPEDAVKPKKQALIAKAADAYIELNHYRGEVRFDIVSVIKNGHSEKIYHISDAFFPGLV